MNPLKEDWEQIKQDVMFYAVEQKFNQNTILKELLLSPNHLEIIQHTKG